MVLKSLSRTLVRWDYIRNFLKHRSSTVVSISADYLGIAFLPLIHGLQETGNGNNETRIGALEVDFRNTN